MTKNDNFYCLILAGGKGRRLWPCSRESFPKQFIDFFGTGRTLLQRTYDRMSKVIPTDHIFINTNVDYVDIVMEQLPEIPRTRIMAEPIHRNTAPSIAWATHRISHLNPDACIIAVPSDQLVINDDVFRQNVLDGLQFVSTHETLLTMGIKPTRPEPGYGYIQMEEPLESNVYSVKTFTEKPNREFATMFMESGEFLWNTGLFLSSVKHLWDRFCGILPFVLRKLDDVNYYATAEQEEAFVQEHFPLYPNMSLESGLLDGAEDVCVMKCSFGWADIGTWHGIYEALPKNNDDNVVIDSDVMMENSRGNVIKLPKGKLGIIDGLEGFIVAEKDNVLLICKKEDSSALVRKYVSEVQLKKGERFV
ncbi:MAG: mannose-1-phosphate guanylyltransferase [Prevotella sp.]|nr:mannose-1-phosphate guanylyltransferase [Prevotella sp.]